MIKGHCKTTLDNYDVSLVNKFVAIPNKGDNIVCKYKGTDTTLRVYQITHDFRENEPYIIIELHN